MTNYFCIKFFVDRNIFMRKKEKHNSWDWLRKISLKWYISFCDRKMKQQIIISTYLGFHENNVIKYYNHLHLTDCLWQIETVKYIIQQDLWCIIKMDLHFKINIPLILSIKNLPSKILIHFKFAFCFKLKQSSTQRNSQRRKQSLK